MAKKKSAMDRKPTTESAKTLEKMQLELRDTLEQMCLTGGEKALEVVSFGSRHNDLRLLFRVYDEAKWLNVLAAYLVQEAEVGWYAYWGKKYMLKDGRIVYGWNCVIEADDLDEAIQQTRRMLIQADHQVNGASRRTVVEIPLPSDLGYSERQQSQVKPTRPSARLR
ncbi:MAG: hypothetical protein ABID40_02485 [Candidatus Bipolaricaulota bacterium]